MNLRVVSLRFEISFDPPRAFAGGGWHFRAELTDNLTQHTYANAVRLRDSDNVTVARELLTAWAEEKALDILHGEHHPADGSLCLRCVDHANLVHAREPQPDWCVVCREVQPDTVERSDRQGGTVLP